MVNHKLWSDILYGHNTNAYIHSNFDNNSLYGQALKNVDINDQGCVKLMFHVIASAAKERDIEWLSRSEYLFDYVNLDYNTTMKLFKNIWKKEDDSK